ncbi:murein biosynthesis integral membrane protein MurJ [Desulfitobacterium metallireducens]|uniref:Probable lipid II flippase MurJ n=1 Tax=Desulfitobacterium metallireducens DSM 15288 TaxID=871968 RepID=W0EED7_9FIRM|nr:murein biosynthesis integral membrane protein MurJ [Desulfitobacterium metallireducens]AHF07878.1 integral membrane protein MviN [Desulfitobacterium metallireducens DSM 15288]
MSGTKTVAKAAGLLMLAQLASRILGFFRESIMAGYFGKTSATDAYNTAFILPDLIYWLLVGGVLSSAFIPVFSEYIHKGNEEEGWRVVSSIVNIIFIGLGILVIIALIFTPQFIQLQVPGFTPENKSLTTNLTRIILIQPLLLALSGITMGILNSYKIFWPSALGTVLYNASVILFGIILARPDHPQTISGFAVGVVVGALMNFLVQIPALRRVGLHYYPVIDWHHPGVKRIGMLAVPIILSYALNQFQVAVNSNLGSHLVAGSITSVWYSYRLFQLPVGIFALAIAVAVFPTLNEHATLKHWKDFIHTSSSAVRMVIFITVPISMGMIVLRFPLIRVLFQHGAFTAEDTAATAIPLFFFAVGISAQSIIQILPRMFYALQDTWTPVTLGIISMIANIIFMLLLVKPLQAGGLAFATSLAAVVNMVMLFYVLRKRLKQIDGRRILRTSLQTLGASLLMGVVVSLWAKGLTSFLGSSTVGSIIILITGTALGALSFAGAAKLMRMEEFNQTLGMVQKKLHR